MLLRLRAFPVCVLPVPITFADSAESVDPLSGKLAMIDVYQSQI